MSTPLEDENGYYDLWFVDDTTRNILWKSKTDRNPFEIGVGESVEHDGKRYSINRVYGPENGALTAIVDPS